MTTKKQARELFKEKQEFYHCIAVNNKKRGYKIPSLKTARNSITTLEGLDRNRTSFIRVEHSYAFLLPRKFFQNYSQRMTFHSFSEMLFKDKNPFNHIKVDNKGNAILSNGLLQRIPFNPNTKKKISGSRNIRMNIISEIKPYIN